MQEKLVREYMFISMLLAGICGAAVDCICQFCLGGSSEKGLMAGLITGFFAMWIYGGYYVRKICLQVDQAGDAFEEILAESSMEERYRRSAEEWKEILKYPGGEGALGRLTCYLLESVHIFGQREVKYIQEKKYLKEMMTDISHQIKTPLASLRVFLDIFEKEFQNEKLLEMVGQAQKQTDRIHRLVMGLLKLTQLESGMLPVQKSREDLGTMLRECAQAVLSGFPEKRLQVAFRGPEECIILCEKMWLSEAFQNIIKNCCEYSPIGGCIRIEWNDSSFADTVKIMDDGPGIEPEELPKIFNRFYQVHGSQKQGCNEEGIGIGLALAKEIIERQGGTLLAYSSTKKPSYTRFESVFMKTTPDNSDRNIIRGSDDR